MTARPTAPGLRVMVPIALDQAASMR